MEPFLLHGIKWNNYDLLLSIIDQGYILPRSMQENPPEDRNNIFNGDDYTSFCQKSLMDGYMFELYRCSFDDFILNKPTLVLKADNVNLIYPRNMTMLEKDMMSTDEWRKLICNNEGERVSYYGDELMTKDKVSLKDNLIAIGLPMDDLKMSYSEEQIEDLVSKIKDGLGKLGREDVPIVNSSIYSFADNMEEIENARIDRGRTR